MWLALRLWLGRRLFGVIGDPTYPTGVLISPSRVVKWPCEQAEVDAMLFAATRTTIPIPKLYRTHVHRGRLGIEMEFVKGTCLDECWTLLTASEKQNIMTQLGSYVAQMRALTPSNDDAVSSASGGPCMEHRVGAKPFGPFSSVEEFHACLRGGMPMKAVAETFGESVVQCHTRKHATRFTHSDLAVQNIMVRDGSIVSILDWGCSGWYPEYWEFTKAHYNRYEIPDFYEMISEHFTQYNDELTAERSLWRLYDFPNDQPRG